MNYFLFNSLTTSTEQVGLWDIPTFWHGAIQLCMLCIIILLANTLRRKVGFLKKSLLPTVVIGGFLGLFIKEGLGLCGITNVFDDTFLENITYHSLAIGFIALGLRTYSTSGKTSSKTVGLKSGLLIVGGYLIQGIVGLTLSGIAYLLITGKGAVLGASGILLPLGFGQGPGQASNMGKLYESLGFSGGQAFGIAIASIGFIWACIMGVIYINYISRKKGLKRVESTESGENNFIEVDGEVPLVESVDKFTLQISIVAVVFLMTFLVMYGIDLLIQADVFGEFGHKSLRSLIWGFNFMFATLFAMVTKQIIKKLRTKKLMTRVYVNDYMMNRIAGVAFDFMIVSAIVSINISELSGNWILFLLITTIGGIVTFFYILKMCKKLYPTYVDEAFVSMYGMLTGTASTGVALLREVDPYFKTPASDNLVTGSVFAIAFGFPIFLLVPFAPKSGVTLLITFIAIIILFIAMQVGMSMVRKYEIKKEKAN